MGIKKNPQITIPIATYQELSEIAEKWGLPSPGLVVPVMVRQFGKTMRDGMLQPSTADNRAAVVSTADNRAAVEITGNGTPTAEFLNMNF